MSYLEGHLFAKGITGTCTLGYSLPSLPVEKSWLSIHATNATASFVAKTTDEGQIKYTRGPMVL